MTKANYSVMEAAEVLQRTRWTVDKWINENARGDRSHIDVGGEQVPVLRIGGRWMVVRDALDRALRGEAVA